MGNSKELEVIQFPEITHIQLVKYAGASGDFNPIHTVEPFAVQAGLGGVIAHGMLVMGFIGESIPKWFENYAIKKFSGRFKGMTKPGEKIVISGHIIEERAGRLFCIARATNVNGDVKIIAKFEVEKEL
ncbi:MaoC/PaaZ C-terminal domain-containing protein [Lysinibacillus sp. NPDC097287]|uniref:MaoC/PaaZ C-terminal domain-containing protein n=1 Tax=Lysinibacillus sp. NPDC097287 TaxID=3364144 RepID=UPI00380D4915